MYFQLFLFISSLGVLEMPWGWACTPLFLCCLMFLVFFQKSQMCAQHFVRFICSVLFGFESCFACVLQNQEFRLCICPVLCGLVSCSIKNSGCLFAKSCAALCPAHQEFRLFICTVLFGLVPCRIENSDCLFAESCSAWCPAESRIQIVYLLSDSLSPVRLCVHKNQAFRLCICSVLLGLASCRIKNSDCLFADSCPVGLVPCRIKNSDCFFAESSSALCPAESKIQMVYLLSPVQFCVLFGLVPCRIKNSDHLFA